MIDISHTIAAKSDQLNADDLIGNSITIKITALALDKGEQPLAINYEGDKGKPYMPCKSMRRILVGVWGKDGNVYIGRSLTLYRDDKVTYGGLNVGGLRISHMSHINAPVTLVLTASNKSKKPFTVMPLDVHEVKVATVEELDIAGQVAAEEGVENLKQWWKQLLPEERKLFGPEKLDALKAIANNKGKTLPVDKTPDNMEDRVNSAIAEISIDRAARGTDEYRDYESSEEFQKLMNEVISSKNDELIAKLSEALM